MSDLAVEYAKQVVNGEIIAGQLAKKAAKRFLDELNHQSTDGFPFHYSSDHVKKVIRFVELLPQTNGKPLKLEPFEIFIFANIYGWRQDRDNSLRFNRVLISEARKNGKSFLMAALGAVALLVEKLPERGRQVLYTANSAQQAHLAFDMLANQLSILGSQHDIIRRRLKIGKQKIEDKKTNSFAVPLATDRHTSDGYNPTLAVVDEYHQARDSTMLEALKSGMVQQDNGLLCIISTAGTSLQSPFKQEVDYVTDMLNGKFKNDRYFAIVYQLDGLEEVNNPDMWIKANPLMSNLVLAERMKENIASQIETAKNQGGMNDVLVKNMNMFVQQSKESYISVQDWNRGLIEEVTDLTGREAYVGVDLSKVDDLTAVSWLIPVGDGKFYVDSHGFVGTHGGIENKSAKDGVDYRKMARLGYCSISKLESGTIDYTEVYNYILDYIDHYQLDLKFVCYDPAKWGGLLNDFEHAGLDTVEVRQGGSTLGIPIRLMKENILNGNILHTKNQLFDYHIGNVIVRYDKFDNPLFDKKNNNNKIDMVAALVTAYAMGMNYYEEKQEKDSLNDYYKSDDFGF